MTSMTSTRRVATVGVDTHGDVHVAAVMTRSGGRFGEPGSRRLRRLPGAAGVGPAAGRAGAFGVEGTGRYGAGLSRYLRRQGMAVVEVNRPDRAIRRRGKSDPIDAEAAARAVLAGTATGIPKAGDDRVEMIRLLKLARDSAVKSRTAAINQIKGVLVTAPAELRESLAGLPTGALLDRCAGLRPGPLTSPTAAAKSALRSLARRASALGRRPRRSSASSTP